VASCGCQDPAESTIPSGSKPSRAPVRERSEDPTLTSPYQGFICGNEQPDNGFVASETKGERSLDEVIDDAIASARSTIVHPVFGELPLGPWSGPALTRNLRRMLAATQGGVQDCRCSTVRSHGIRAMLSDVLRAKTAPTRFAVQARSRGVEPASLRGKNAPPKATPEDVGTKVDADDLRVGPGARELDLDEEEEVEFHLGDVHLKFPLQWLYDHWRSVLDGTGPTQADVVEAIWGDFADSVRADGDASEEWAAKVMEKRIGCVNMPMDPTMWLFYRDGGGAPEAVILNTLRLIHANIGALEDRFSGTDHGKGYPEFWAELLGSSLDLPDLPYRARHLDPVGVFYPDDWPGPARSALHDYHPGERRDVQLNFVSDDERYNGESSVDFGECGLPDIENMTVAGRPVTGWHPWDYGGPIDIDDPCADYNGSCPTYGVGGMSLPSAFAREGPDDVRGHVFMRALTLTRLSYNCDELMFWAQAAIARYWESNDYEQAALRYESHFVPAWWLGRMVLHYLSFLAHIEIHEVGHVFNMGSQGGHCEKGCFMETSAYGFQAAVLGRYGIPLAARHYLNASELPRELCLPLGGRSTAFGYETEGIFFDGGCLNNMNGILHLTSEGEPGSAGFLCVNVPDVGSCKGDEYATEYSVEIMVVIANLGLCGSMGIAEAGTSSAPYRCSNPDLGLTLFDADGGRWLR